MSYKIWILSFLSSIVLTCRGFSVHKTKKLTTQSTQDEEQQNKNTTLFVLDITIRWIISPNYVFALYYITVYKVNIFVKFSLE
jgi:hypothetical protein